MITKLKSNKDILDLVESHKRVWKRDISKKVGKMSKSYILAQKSTKLINIKTGEEWQFESLTETAKFLQTLTPPYKVAPGTLSYVINKGTIYKGTFKLMYQIVRKYSTSSRPEAYTYEPFIRELSNNQPNQLSNIESGFAALLACAEKVLNMTKWTIGIMGKYIFLGAPAPQKSSWARVIPLNNFLSSFSVGVSFLNSLFASFANKFIPMRDVILRIILKLLFVA